LSVAVAELKAIITPVPRNAEAIGFLEIEKGMGELGKGA